MKYFDMFLKYLVWYSVGMYFYEINLGTANSLESPKFFLWSERFVALIFTFEYGLRWYRDQGWKISDYPKSALGIIDLIAIIPFWVGFFVPASWLGLIRTLRVLRLLKFYRYSKSLQQLMQGFWEVRHQLMALGFIMLIVILFNMAGIHETEKAVQPDQFGNLWQTFWFSIVTMSTVGYGDRSPISLPGQMFGCIAICLAIPAFAAAAGIMGKAFEKVGENNDASNELTELVFACDQLDKILSKYAWFICTLPDIENNGIVLLLDSKKVKEDSTVDTRLNIALRGNKSFNEYPVVTAYQ